MEASGVYRQQKKSKFGRSHSWTDTKIKEISTLINIISKNYGLEDLNLNEFNQTLKLNLNFLDS